ncbi:MAG: ANTAR domain-containing protein [Butyrivibrio sp.]|nr:ANTAR domain-containing protein [Butyrivibrio sp.]
MNIIVAFAKASDAQNFKSILSRGGYDGVVTCSSGVQALSAMDDLGSGVVICGYRLSDMLYSELLEDLPPYFKMLMIASTDRAPSETENENFIYLSTPLQKSALFSTLNMMMEGVQRLKKKAKERRMKRSDADKRIIEQAKALLMERHHMTEPEAHKYLQKCAMDSGTDLLETAEMIISLTNI